MQDRLFETYLKEGLKEFVFILGGGTVIRIFQTILSHIIILGSFQLVSGRSEN